MKGPLWILIMMVSLSACSTSSLRQLASNELNAPNVIDSYEKVKIGGFNMQIWIRGNDLDKPLLLFLHGGPGEPHMPDAGAETNLLVNDYIVVQWDQRGAGASSSEVIDPKSLTVQLMKRDTYDMIRYLLDRFQKSKIFLLGHSWGAELGLLVAHEHPELLHAYVAIGLPVGGIRALYSLRGKIVAKAKAERKRLGWSSAKEDSLQALSKLDIQSLFLDPDPFRERWENEFSRPRRNLGFTWVYDEKKADDYLKRPENDNPHVSWFTYESESNVGKVNSNLLLRQAFLMDVSQEVKELRVPIFAFLGRHDFNIDSDMTEKYLKKLKAPVKRIIWFEKSAHMMTFEEPELFQHLMTQVIPLLSN